MPGGRIFRSISNLAVKARHIADSAIEARHITAGVITAAKLAAGLKPINVLTETFAYSAFTDGGGTSGTKSFAGSIPAGAVVLAAAITVNTAFTGDSSAALKLGDGTDDARYMTGTASVFTAHANGLDMGVPSSARFHDTAKTPVITVTSGSDFTNVAAGSVTISIYYI